MSSCFVSFLKNHTVGLGVELGLGIGLGMVLGLGIGLVLGLGEGWVLYITTRICLN